MTQTKKNTRLITTIILIVFYLALIAILHRRNEIIDDAFITYRYAANLAEGHGMVFNEGQAVLGTTTPAYTILLSSFAVVFGSEAIPTISLWINMFATIGVMFCIALATYKLSGESYILALLAPLVVFGSIVTLEVMVWGMEGSVLLLMIATSIVLLLYRRWLWVCILAGITIWLRPEGVFFIGLVGFTILGLTLQKKMSWRDFFIYGTILTIPSVLYFLMLVTFYNTLLPQSVISKAGGLYPGDPFGQVNIVLQYLISPLILIVGTLTGNGDIVLTNPTIFIAMIPIALFFLVIGSIQVIKLDRILWIIPALLLLNVIFYGSRSTLIFPWYHANYHVLVIILMTLGVGQLLHTILSAITDKPVILASGLISLILICVPNIVYTPYGDYLQEARQRHYVSGHMLDYHNLLVEIGDDIPSDAVVALHEIGYIGFYMRDNLILDTAGLVSPEIVDYFPIPLDLRGDDPLNGAIPPQSMLDYQPEVIITLDSFVKYGFYEVDWFDDLYSIEYRVPNVVGFGVNDLSLDVIILRDELDRIVIDTSN